MARRLQRLAARSTALVVWLMAMAAPAAGQPAPSPVQAPDASPPPVTWVARNWTRVEVWRYQRGYDGARVDVDRPGWHVSATAMWPTQGGFEERAGVGMTGVRLLGATANARPDRVLPGTDVQLFAWRYDDTRPVQARPDNTGLTAGSVDVHLNTFGATLVGSWPAGRP